MMTDLSTKLEVTGALAQSPGEIGHRAAVSVQNATHFGLAFGAAFILYCGSAFVLHAHDATTHFGADSWYYAELAPGNVFSRIQSNYYLDRVARFHPTTVFMAAAWMQILSPLARWIAPLYLLKSMFAVVGAAGVAAAMSAFATVMPRRYAVILAAIYATSFGVWYFASFEESKIVTASLCTLYIAIYLQIREAWTVRGAVLLTAILLIACLNEMISGFLVVIPAVDTLMRHGWDWRKGRWIALHALAGPLAFVIIEGVLFGRLVAASHPEGTSHFGMLFAYIARNHYDAETTYSFVANWLFFNIAAPTPDASYGIAPGANYKGHFYKGYFEPSLLNYFLSPASVGVAILFCALAVASMLPRYRPLYRVHDAANVPALLLALLAFTICRGAFFFIFNPTEPLLFSPAVTLPHLLLVAIPFVASRLPAKSVLLAVFGALLFIANAAFMVRG